MAHCSPKNGLWRGAVAIPRQGRKPEVGTTKQKVSANPPRRRRGFLLLFAKE